MSRVSEAINVGNGVVNASNNDNGRRDFGCCGDIVSFCF
jgi:hypothetical protein